MMREARGNKVSRCFVSDFVWSGLVGVGSRVEEEGAHASFDDCLATAPRERAAVSPANRRRGGFCSFSGPAAAVGVTSAGA